MNDDGQVWRLDKATNKWYLIPQDKNELFTEFLTWPRGTMINRFYEEFDQYETAPPDGLIVYEDE